MSYDVHLLQLPVALWVRSHEQFEALLREFTMISLGHPDDDDVPQRMLALMASFSLRFPQVGEPEVAIRNAAAAGLSVLEDLVYPTEAGAGEAAMSLLRLLDEVDSYCARANEMLVLAQDSDAVRLRRWFLTCFVDQLAGKPPVPWPEWS